MSSIREAFQEMIDFEEQVLYQANITAEVEEPDTGSLETVEISLQDICQQFRYEDLDEYEDDGRKPRAEIGNKVGSTDLMTKIIIL